MNDRDRMEFARGALREKFICRIAAALLVKFTVQPKDWIADQALQYADALIDRLIESELELDTPTKPS